MVFWFLVGILGFILGGLYVVTRSWTFEMVETGIFVEFYEASNLLELCSKEDENSPFYARKAKNKVKLAISSLETLYSKLEETRSKLFKNRFAKPLRSLGENLETRILPRIAQQKDIEIMRSVLRGLASLFGEAQKPISLDDIVSKNKDLEHFEYIESEEKATTRLRIILSKNPIKFSFSIFLGFFITAIPVLIHWKLYQTDLLDLLSNLTTFVEIFGIGIASGLAIYAVWRRKA